MALLASFVLSVGLGLAVAHTVLGTVLFFMLRSRHAYRVVNTTTARKGELYESQADALAASVA
jgi:predicted small secreted protein